MVTLSKKRNYYYRLTIAALASLAFSFAFLVDTAAGTLYEPDSLVKQISVTTVLELDSTTLENAVTAENISRADAASDVLEEAIAEEEARREAERIAAEHKAALEAAPAMSIIIGNTVIPYVNCHYATVCPEYTAGLWKGNGLVDDGTVSYFVGHNPGVFSPVRWFGMGSTFNVKDSNGNCREYTVVDMITIEDTYLFSYISDWVYSFDEAALVQTCRLDYPEDPVMFTFAGVPVE